MAHFVEVAKAGTADWDKLMALAASMEPKLRLAFLRSLHDTLGKLTYAEVVRALELGTWENLVDLATQNGATFAPLREGIRVGIGAAAQHTASGIKGFAGAVDMYHPGAVQFLKDYTLDRIRQFTDEMREGVREAVHNGLVNGWNPRKTAREIRSISTFGLTSRQRAAVNNFRRLVETGDREALTRALRDKRFDASLKKQILGEVNLSREQIDKMVEAYERRYLRYRSETIARTESIRALSSGNRVGWQQFLDQRGKGSTALRRKWYVSPGERTCEFCRPIPRMNPDGRGFDELFETPLGPYLDPPLHPDCRCTILTRLA